MNILVKKLLIGDKLVDCNIDTPLELALMYLKICMKEDGFPYSSRDLKVWLDDYVDYLIEINDEELSEEDCLDEICSNIMWTNSPFAFDGQDKQVPNDYIRLAENELYKKLENVLK